MSFVIEKYLGQLKPTSISGVPAPGYQEFKLRNNGKRFKRPSPPSTSSSCPTLCFPATQSRNADQEGFTMRLKLYNNRERERELLTHCEDIKSNGLYLSHSSHPSLFRLETPRHREIPVNGSRQEEGFPRYWKVMISANEATSAGRSVSCLCPTKPGGILRHGPDRLSVFTGLDCLIQFLGQLEQEVEASQQTSNPHELVHFRAVV